MLNKVSTAGYVCQVILAIVLIIVASVVVSTNWWVVYFWDCPSINDESSIAYYMVLKKGFCVDPDQGQENNYDDCTKWSDVKDDSQDDDIKDSAQQYIDALNLGTAAVSFSVFFLVLSAVAFVPMVRKWDIFRYFTAAVVFVAGFMFLGSVGAASETWFTDTSNYVYAHQYCDNEVSFGYSGYIGAVIGMVLAFVAFMSLLFPCCCCADKEDIDSAHHSTTASTAIHETSNPVSAPVVAAPIVAHAVPASDARLSGSTISYKN